MKYLAILALALFGASMVAAEAEAEADSYYGGYYGRGHGYGYGGYGYGGYGYGRGYGYGQGSYYGHGGYGGYGYPSYGYGYRHGLYKRDAEAEPEAEAEADSYYGNYYGAGGYPGHGYAYGGYGRGVYGYGNAYGYGGNYYGNAYGYGNYYGAGYPSRFYGHGYQHGLYNTAVSHQEVHTPAASYGVHQVHKREAEAQPEADAYYGNFYGGYPGYGIAPYNPYYNLYRPQYYAVPTAVSHQEVHTPAASYGIHQVHKREAEAEPHYYGYGRGIAGHPGLATSYTYRSPQGARGFSPFYRGFYHY